MAATDPCRAGYLARAVSFFANTAFDVADDACPHPAETIATVREVWPGLEAELHAQLCRGHDQALQSADGYVKSIPIRYRVAP
jgi:hypothetical protein